MTFFDKIIQQIFPKERPLKNGLMLSEALRRSEKDKSAYFKWLNEGGYRPLLASVKEAYELKKQKETGKLQVHLLETPYANGFALTYHVSISPLAFQNLFDLLKDKVVDIGYMLNVSDRRIFDKGSYVETKEKYYLKPPIKAIESDTLFDQQYGNILIEYSMIDDKPSYLKLVANIYADRLYTKALPFEGLAQQIFA